MRKNAETEEENFLVGRSHFILLEIRLLLLNLEMRLAHFSIKRREREQTFSFQLHPLQFSTFPLLNMHVSDASECSKGKLDEPSN
jgi:hypothetical protein